MSSIDHIVVVMCTENSLTAKCIPNSSRHAQTNSRTAQKLPAHAIEKACSCQKLVGFRCAFVVYKVRMEMMLFIATIQLDASEGALYAFLYQ